MERAGMAKGDKGRLSNLDKTIEELNRKPRRKGVNLYLDEELYKEAQAIFGKRVSAICEAALRDAIEKSKEKPS